MISNLDSLPRSMLSVTMRYFTVYVVVGYRIGIYRNFNILILKHE
jgi:hypothetical protein